VGESYSILKDSAYLEALSIQVVRPPTLNADSTLAEEPQSPFSR